MAYNFPAHKAALKAACRTAPSGWTPSNQADRAAQNGRMVFGDGNSNIYGIEKNGTLKFYKHSGSANGTWSWSKEGLVVGTGWDVFNHVFTGGSGVIYAVDGLGQLRWYKHLDQVNGSATWHSASGSIVGTGWHFNQIFAAPNGTGVIYAVNAAGELRWYKHSGFASGTNAWSTGSGNIVGTAFNTLKNLIASEDGTMYGVDENQNLRWYKHLGHATGTFTWASNSAAIIGDGWVQSHLFGGGQGLICAVNGNLDLQWYRHLDPGFGGASWVVTTPRVVGAIWAFRPR